MRNFSQFAQLTFICKSFPLLKLVHFCNSEIITNFIWSSYLIGSSLNWRHIFAYFRFPVENERNARFSDFLKVKDKCSHFCKMIYCIELTILQSALQLVEKQVNLVVEWIRICSIVTHVLLPKKKIMSTVPTQCKVSSWGGWGVGMCFYHEYCQPLYLNISVVPLQCHSTCKCTN